MESKPKVIRFKNAWILTNGDIIKEDLWIRDGKILNPMDYFFKEKKMADYEVDCKELIISPGFIDVQCNGAYDIDCSDTSGTSDDIIQRLDTLSVKLLQHGVTGFCPTIISCDTQDYKILLEHIRPRRGSVGKGAAIIGLHLEGPFICKKKKGCHFERFIIEEVTPQHIKKVYGSDLSGVAIITLAPELKGAIDSIDWLQKEHPNIVVSLGHSMSDYTTAEQARRSGATFITHLFNAMLPFHHRDPGIVGLLTDVTPEEDQAMYYGMIADRFHTHQNVVRIAHRAHRKGIVLVTDATLLLGQYGGEHKLGEVDVEVHSKPNGYKAVMKGTDTLAGSLVSMEECVAGFSSSTGCDLSEALEAATLHPAKLLGIDTDWGSLDYGKEADFVLLKELDNGERLQVQATFIAGELAWQIEEKDRVFDYTFQ